MASPIILTSQEQVLYDSICKDVSTFHEYYQNRMCTLDNSQVEELYKNMAEAAHKLHMQLRARGIEPQHHKYMIENRGVPVDNLEFYNHLHPVEDLIAFVKDSDANNDPEDSTLNVEFNFNVYTRRWGHYDYYRIVRTNTGWRIKGASVFGDGECDKSGKPFLESFLNHDTVCYPAQIGEFFEWAWKMAADGATKEEIQQGLDDLGEWISICEKSTPRGIFEGLI